MATRRPAGHQWSPLVDPGIGCYHNNSCVELSFFGERWLHINAFGVKPKRSRAVIRDVNECLDMCCYAVKTLCGRIRAQNSTKIFIKEKCNFEANRQIFSNGVDKEKQFKVDKKLD